MLSQLKKLKEPNYQHKFAAGRKCLFHFDVEIWYGRNSGRTYSYGMGHSGDAISAMDFRSTLLLPNFCSYP